jgi:large repetitive protein
VVNRLEKLRSTLMSLSLVLSLLLPLAAQATTITAGVGPWAIAVNPMTNKVYVANYSYFGEVTIIDGGTATATSVFTGYSPAAVAVNPVTNKTYVANFNGDSVTVIDGATNSTHTVVDGTARGPAAIAINTETNRVYVGNYKTRNVTVIDGSTNAVIAVVSLQNSSPVGVAPHICLAVNPITNKVYVTNYHNNSVTVIDGATNTPVNVTVGSYPWGVAVNPATNRVYITNNGSANVTVIDGSSDIVTATLTVGGYPKAVAINPATNRIYVANYNSAGTVSVLDGATNIVTSVAVGVNPVTLSVNPVTNRIYVVNEQGNNLTVINGATSTVAATLPVGQKPAAVAMNVLTNQLYVANNNPLDPLSYPAYGSVTALAETPVPQTPLATVITPLPGNTTSTQTPTFTMTATSTTGSPVRRIYYQIDSLQGSWLAADSVTGSFSCTTAPLTPGNHTIYAFATDGNDATTINTGYQSSPLIGAPATYTFTVTTLAPVTYSVTPATALHGSISPNTLQLVNQNQTISFSVTPDNGYTVFSVTGCGGTLIGTTYTTAPVTADCTVTPVFSLKQVPAITWATPAAITYGAALSATQLNAAASVAGSFAYSPAAGTILTAGTQTLSVTFTPTDSITYTTATATVSLAVNKASATVALSGQTQSYDGTAKSVTTVTTPAGLAVSVTYNGSATAPTAAGSYPIVATITDANYTGSATGTLTIAKATPVITWATPAAVTVGTTLSTTQLNATSSVPGSFVYTPASGTVLNTIGNQALSVTFTPTDSANYTTATATVSLAVIAKVVPTITWANPATITYGTALSTTQLNAVASVAGTYVYAPAVGAVLTAGTQTLSVTFTPTDTVTYTTATANVSLTVSKAAATMALSGLTQIYDGTAKSVTAATTPAGLAMSVTYNGSTTAPTVAGSYPVVATITETNYTGSATGTLTIAKATPVITWATPAAVTVGTTLSTTQLNATSSVPGSFVYTPASGTVLNTIGTQAVSVTFTPTDSINYTTATATVSLTVIGTATRSNVALAANGGVASGSSTIGATTYPFASLNNGDRKGTGWGAGGGWNDATINSYPDWAQITFNGQKSISEIDLFTLQDSYTAPQAPTTTMTFTKYGITAFDVQYWDGAAWVTLPGGSITGNNLVWRTITFPTVTTDRIRVMVNAALGSYSRIVEIEAY